MGTYLTRLEKIFKQLEEKTPFTKKEKSELSKRDRVFVRNLQIKDKSTKGEAIQKYKDAILKGPSHYKKLRNDTTSFVKDLYPVHDKKIPSSTVEPTRSGQRVQRIKPQEFKKVLEKTTNKKNKQRLINAHKKYPDASLFELRNGVSSKKSQQYRLKNGRPDQYEGRINV